MPTPNDGVLRARPTSLNVHTTCPENDRPEPQRRRQPRNLDRLQTLLAGRDLQPFPPSRVIHTPDSQSDNEEIMQRAKSRVVERAIPMLDVGSPAPSTSESESKDSDVVMTPTSTIGDANIISTESTTLTGFGFPVTRVRPSYSSSFLRSGSRFIGSQQSDKQIYNVEVSIKHVDMKESFLCGYLRIEGLTPDHPTLTTYFESEIIGPKYTFQTKHESWGATEKTDMQHWDRFPAWRPLARLARKPDFHYKECAQKENIFMRWKEYFLVPDHRVREIKGASFEGFYYICFNQVTGTVSGIYFHSKSEKFQQLELKHVDDMGCLGAIEFR